ncbi:MAG: putative bifunctional diguanylate cyclase/phosphodiesterase [Spirulina sp.]
MVLALKQLSRRLGLVVLLIGVTVLVGWALAIPWLQRVWPSLPTMKPNTALGFLLAGTALWLDIDTPPGGQRRFHRPFLVLALALICFGLGTVTFVESIFRWDWGLGEWPFFITPDQFDPAVRGRLAPNTALNFMFFGGAMGLFHRQRYAWAQGCGLAMFYIALVGFLGYLYSVELLYGVGSVSAMALHTSLTFLLLACGLLARHPHQGIISILTADHAGGSLVRRVVLAVGIVPILLCGLILFGHRQGWYSNDFGIVLLGVSVMLLLSLLTWWSGLVLGQTDYYASFDTLTGLPNRRRFEQQLSQWMMDCRQHRRLLCILFLDIDRFKYINDVLGHDLGDELLVAMGQRLQQATPSHGLLARWGGDEFIVLIPKIQSLEDGVTLAEQILATLIHPFQVQNNHLNISTSMGIAIFPEDGEDLRALLQKADLALYEAKQLGRNTYQVYSQTFAERVTESLALENAIVRALEQQEFSLHFQPKLHLMTGQIAGLEVLLRWYSPDLGVVSPGRFIPIAEETGLIVAIGSWVLREVCRQGQIWYQQGLLPVPLAVNISALQMHQANLIPQIEALLAEFDLPPALLELEITETVAMQDLGYLQAKLHQLSDLGLSLSLDDFGTGFSSLSYLSHFPLHRLKIDKSFIDHITTSPSSQAITRSVIELGHGLNMQVVAEGVEHQEQLAYLRSVNCDEIQGYVFHRPLPVDQATDLLRMFQFRT